MVTEAVPEDLLQLIRGKKVGETFMVPTKYLHPDGSYNGTASHTTGPIEVDVTQLGNLVITDGVHRYFGNNLDKQPQIVVKRGVFIPYELRPD